MLRNRLALAAVLAGAAVILPAGPAHADAPACTTTFTGAISDAWEVAGNWDAGVPDADSVACWTDDPTVVITSGDQAAKYVEGWGLSVAGGSLTLVGDASPDLGHFDSKLYDLHLAGGNLTLASSRLSVVTTDWSDGELDLANHMWSDRMTIGGSDGAPALAGTGSIAGHNIEIDNPNMTTSGTPELSVYGGALTLGAGVVVHHVGSGQATFHVSASESYGTLSLPADGTAGFDDDVYVGALDVPAGLTFVAGAVRLVCERAAHGGQVGCPSITGAGVLQTSAIWGTVPSDPYTFLGGLVSVARMTGPLTVGPGVRLHLAKDDPIVVTGGPITLRGDVIGAGGGEAGDVLPVISDEEGIVRDGDRLLYPYSYGIAATGTTYSLVVPDESVVTAVVDSVSDNDVTITAHVTSAGSPPSGGIVELQGCGHSWGPDIAGEGALSDGAATITIPRANVCGGDTGRPSTVPVVYVGDDAAPYGHRPASTSVTVDPPAPPPGSATPSSSATPSTSATPSPSAPPTSDAPPTPSTSASGEPDGTVAPAVQNSCAAPGGPKASSVNVKRGVRFRVTGQVVLVCNDTPGHDQAVPKRTRVDLTPRGKKAFLPGIRIGYLAVDPDQHVHGWVTIPKSVKPGTYAIHVYGASRVLAITVR